ncbi:MAG: pyridoxamine 5'-phosphate oxidase family protein [Bacteroidota bacterium]
MTGQLSNSQIDTLLESCSLGRLGCYAQNTVYVVPVSYAFEGEYVYSHTREGMKVNMMRENPDVCFEVDQIDNMANWRSAILWGKYEELAGHDREEALQKICNRFVPITTSIYSLPAKDIHAKDIASVAKLKEVVFRIKIEKRSGRFEKR